MDLELVFAYDEGYRLALSEGEVHAICQLVLEHQHIDRTCSLSVSVVSDVRIAEMNAEWRGNAQATDVLSIECEQPNDPGLMPGEPCVLGDIILAPRYIAQQARDMHTTAHDETLLMLVHACLHLLGYDHTNEDEARVMQAIEDDILQQLPSDNSLTPVVLMRHREEEA